ncbi:MAG: DNA adenine methylase [Lachnospiraceae bacterium]|nr:DNA adenine methylase [Lachnospiraceae bacterium]
MRLTDYVHASPEMKERYFNTLTTQVGLRYFGGKSKIGKFIINRIFEMQAYRYVHNNPAKTFVDCFAGGGKIALTIPTGWFDTIVINDLNYGVYSYYVCCRDNPLALIDMIERLGKIMSKDMFKLFAYVRSTPGKMLPEIVLKELGIEITDDLNADMLLSAAMTYWVTASSWEGETDPDNLNYALDAGDKDEKAEIEKRVNIAKKRIMQINSKMLRQNFIIENMDYVDLIAKYSKKYGESVIWYMDPPYHEATLNKSNENTTKKSKDKVAPYEDSFSYADTMKMTYLLSNMKWFIKSDYDPEIFFRDPFEELDKDDKRQQLEPNDHFHDFDIIEDIDKGFVKEYLGTFAKSNNSDATFTGHEVIWTRYDGSPESVAFLGVKEGDAAWKSWQRKKETRDRWLFIKKEIGRCYLIAMLFDKNNLPTDEELTKIIEESKTTYENLN